MEAWLGQKSESKMSKLIYADMETWQGQKSDLKMSRFIYGSITGTKISIQNLCDKHNMEA